MLNSIKCFHSCWLCFWPLLDVKQQQQQSFFVLSLVLKTNYDNENIESKISTGCLE